MKEQESKETKHGMCVLATNHGVVGNKVAKHSMPRDGEPRMALRNYSNGKRIGAACHL